MSVVGEAAACVYQHQ